MRAPGSRRGSAPRRNATRAELEAELHELRRRLTEAEDTLRAIGNDDVDALVVVARERQGFQVRTIGGAEAPPYEHLLGSMPQGALTVDERGNVVHASQRMLEISGRDALLGEPADVLFHDPHVLRTLLQNAGREPLTARALLVRPDGGRTEATLSASVLPLAGPKRIGIVVSVPAVRSSPIRIAPEDEPQTPIRGLERVLAQLPIGIVIVQASDGQVVFANPAAEQIYGHVLVGVGRPISHVELSCWRPDGSIVEREQLPVARVIRGEPLVREELARPRPDGTFVQTRTTAAPILRDDGELEAVLLAVEDASEDYVARLEREANERFRETFIGVLGHDLRNPLSTTMVGAALLRRRGGLSPEQATVVDRIASSTDRMARMVDQLLDFARSRLGGGIPLRREPIGLHDVARRVIAELETMHKGRVVETVVDGPVVGEWDADRLEQVVSNLVSNALTHGSPDRPVRVSIREEKGLARLEVHNDGAPIPADLLPHIFDPFRRATTEGGGGVGLGLYIAQQIVHAHGGTITVESSAGSGTTFAFVLPRVPR